MYLVLCMILLAIPSGGYRRCPLSGRTGQEGGPHGQGWVGRDSVHIVSHYSLNVKSVQTDDVVVFITARILRMGKAIFSQVSVCYQVGDNPRPASGCHRGPALERGTPPS